MTWPDFKLQTFMHDLRTHPVFSYAYTSTLGEFELFADYLTDPRAPNAKILHFNLWPDLDLTHDHNIKMLTID